MLKIMFTEARRLRVCFALSALTAFNVALSMLNVTLGYLSSLVEGYSGSPYNQHYHHHHHDRKHNNYNDDFMIALIRLALVAIVFNGFAGYMSYISMYPERRARMRMKLMLATLLQSGLALAFV